MAKKKISELVKELTGDFLLENGLELYHCEFVKEGRDWFLRVYIDKHDPDSYVSTDDCEMVSRFLSDRLDEEDPIAQNYYLEVSSPGMDRILYEPEHFEKFKGKQVEVKLYKAINGRKVFTGTLMGLGDGFVIVKIDDGEQEEMRFAADQAAAVRLAVVF